MALGKKSHSLLSKLVVQLCQFCKFIEIIPPGLYAACVSPFQKPLNVCHLILFQITSLSCFGLSIFFELSTDFPR